MDQEWSVAGQRVIEVGDPQQPVRELRVGLIAGRIDVVATDEDVARIEVAHVHGRDLEVRWSSGVLTVRHPQVRWDGLLDGLKGRGGDAAELSIAVPSGTRVELGTVSADGLLAGMAAPATVKTVSGALVLDGVHAQVSARTVSGRIDVRDQHGSFDGESVSGSLTVQAVDLPALRVKTVSGELAVDLHGSPSSLSLKSVSGDLTVRIPAGAGFRLEARTVSGEVVADGHRVGKRSPGRTKGQLRDGDESVRVVATSVSGDVTLLRTCTPAPDDETAAAS